MFTLLSRPQRRYFSVTVITFGVIGNGRDIGVVRRSLFGLPVTIVAIFLRIDLPLDGIKGRTGLLFDHILSIAERCGDGLL